MRDDLKADVRKSSYYSFFIDGSTDKSVTEKELMYIMYIHEGKPKVNYLAIRDVEHAHSLGITDCINRCVWYGKICEYLQGIL